MRRAPARKVKVCRWCIRTATVKVTASGPGGCQRLGDGVIVCGPRRRVSFYTCDQHEARARAEVGSLPYRRFAQIDQGPTLF